MRWTMWGLAAMTAAMAGCGDSGGGSGSSSGDPERAGRTVTITVSDDGCDPQVLRLAPGPVTFHVTGKGNAKVGEWELTQGDRIVGEAEGLEGDGSGSFTLDLQPGTYGTRCPGARERFAGRLIVRGARRAGAADPALAAGVARYRGYVEREATALVTRVRALRSALRSGKVARARAAYAAARVPYERIEPIAESFGDLDPAIDARANDVPRGAWTGFHPIERALWTARTAAGTASLADGLVRDSERLARLVATVKLQPAQVANGANELLNEVAKSKITGEEERYSHLDLLDFAANVEGARAAYDAVAPVLRTRDGALARTIEARFARVTAALARHRRGDGYEPYGALSERDVRLLAQEVDALAEPLSEAPARAVSP